MSHAVEVDQSNRTDESGDTYLALSDGISRSIKVPSKVKQTGMEALLQRGKTSTTAKWMLFAACIFLLIKDEIDQLQRISVDNAFDQHQADVKNQLLRHIWTIRPSFDPWSVEVISIGKDSPAHDVAYSSRKRGEADKTVTAEELLELVD